jgi:RNA polymerase sigma-70 factor (ECF subfamily)
MGTEIGFSDRVQSLVARLSQREPCALTELVDVTSFRLVRFAVALSRHQQDAEDAVQAVFVRLAAEPQRMTAVATAWNYLLGMVRNEVLANVRRHKRCSPSGTMEELVTRCPVDEAEREESYRAVWKAIRDLPTAQAEVVVLKIWEGMTFAEIGETLQLSPNTVASRFQYAMTKLTSSLRAQQGVHRD